MWSNVFMWSYLCQAWAGFERVLACSCSAVIQKEDDEGIVGVKIGKELMKVAGMALKANITRLGPRVLPISEQLIFAGNFVARKVSSAADTHMLWPLANSQPPWQILFVRPVGVS